MSNPTLVDTNQPIFDPNKEDMQYLLDAMVRDYSGSGTLYGVDIRALTRAELIAALNMLNGQLVTTRR